jgi:hypothetical protein
MTARKGDLSRVAAGSRDCSSTPLDLVEGMNMIGNKTVISVIFALFVSAFAAASTSAAQRAFTCAPGGTQFSDAHCLSAGSGFGHVEISNGSPTTITTTNEKTASGTTAAAVIKLKSKISGVTTEVQCTGLSVSGELTNSETFVEGTGTVAPIGCTVTAPAEKGCVIGEGSPKEVIGTTQGQAANSLKITPISGSELGAVRIEGCSKNIPPTNNYPLSGSLVLTLSGATVTATHAGITGQGTLTFGGNAAGVEGAATISMQGGNPIVFT